MDKILIVEDEERNMKLVTDILTMQGYYILQASNGAEGISIALKERPSLILMDIEMPVMDGLTALKKIRANPDISHTRVVVITARAMLGDEERVMKAGADYYLAKPYKFQELLSIVGRYCSASKH